MKIEELSIGDWVCAKLAKWESDDADMTPPLQVKRINGIERHNLYVELFNPTNNTIEHSAFVEDLIPVPLTPEILEKNGFEPPRKGVMFDTWTYIDVPTFVSLANSKYTDYAYYMTYEREGLQGLNQMSFPIYNVHELQHALRLADIEKQIEV